MSEKKLLDVFTFYSKNYTMSSSSASIFNTCIDTVVVFLNVVDNQCAFADVQSTFEIAVGQMASRDDDIVFGSR